MTGRREALDALPYGWLLCAIAGFVAGAASRWLFGQEEVARRVWAATLLLAGAPFVWQTLRAVALARGAWLVSGDPGRIQAVLVVATPCPLILAPPVAIIGGINRAARRGIVVKSGAAVEALGQVDAATFDKTGTLTYGRPAVRRVVPLAKDLETAELLALDGSGPAEAALPHAAALAAHVGARLPEPAERRRASRLGEQHAPIDDDQRAGHVRRRV